MIGLDPFDALMEEVMAKICRVCKEIKETTEFTKNNQRKTGYDSKCKACHAHYNKKYVVQRRKENQTPKEKTIVDNKYCLSCFVEQSIANFVKCFSSKDGHRNTCVTCDKKRRHDLMEERLRARVNNNIPLRCPDCGVYTEIKDCHLYQLKRKLTRCKSCQIIKDNKIKDLRTISASCTITRIEFEFLLKKQNGVCAICKNQETRKMNGKLMRLSVDHNHTTEQIRGLLCSSCNRGIGFMKESSVFLRDAADYLDSYANA